MCMHDGMYYPYYLHDVYITLLHCLIKDKIRAVDKSNQISEFCYSYDYKKRVLRLPVPQ